MTPHTKITWSKSRGYECSSLGDKRFSALFATLEDGRTIEMHYQCDVKGYNPGGKDWRNYKGMPPKFPTSPDFLWHEYLALWKKWAKLHPELMEELRDLASKHGDCLSDKFSRTRINQARALSYILNTRMAA